MRKTELDLQVLPIEGKTNANACEMDVANKIEAMYNNVCDTIVNIPALLDEIYSSFFDAKEQAKAMRECIHSQPVVDLMTERNLIEIDTALEEIAEDIEFTLKDLIKNNNNV